MKRNFLGFLLLITFGSYLLLVNCSSLTYSFRALFSFILYLSIISICSSLEIFFSSIMVGGDGFLIKCKMGLDCKLRTVSFPENIAWPSIKSSRYSVYPVFWSTLVFCT